MGPALQLSDELVALVWEALTGESPGEAPAMPVGRLAERLAEEGWDAARLAQRAAGEMTAGRAWPTPIPARRRGGIGAAQVLAAIRATREAMGLVEDVRLRDATMPLSPGDRALIAERPPHHGAVG